MNILVTGNLSCLAGSLARALTNEKVKVVLAGPRSTDLNLQLAGVTAYPVAPTERAFRELTATYKFDAVIYLATREEQLLAAGLPSAAQVLDGLHNALESCRAADVRRFILISSTEVYGDQEDTTEAAALQPASPNAYSLVAAEQSCRYYSDQFGLNAMVVRVPFVYGQDEKGGLLHSILEDCRAQNRVTLPARDDAVLSILPAAEVADFVLRVLDARVEPWQAVNLSSAHPLPMRQLAALLEGQFPGLQVAFDPAGRLFTRAASVATAKQYYDWLPVDELPADLPSLVNAMQPLVHPRPRPLQWLREHFPQYPVYLKWVEVLLGAWIMTWLTGLTGSFVEFRYVDFRLMYVILMGLMYGTQVGLVASLLASLSVALSATRLGLEWTELVYNVANWLPFAVYLTAGALSGYLQDKRENEANFQNEQTRLMAEKYEYLYGVHQDVVQVKDQYYQQLLGSRDSFGRIFSITRELDTLDEEEVLFKALSILEDVMGSNSIAIYSLNGDGNFARLEVHSSALEDRLSRSLDLKGFPELQASLRQGDIYQNRRLQPNYPAYFAPLLSDGKPAGAVAIWDAKFEQRSLYYYNLFKIICGLIQSSIRRAMEFLNANQRETYVSGTRILQAEPFKRILRIRNTMKREKTGNYLLARVDQTGSRRDWVGLEQALSPVIRAGDHIGLLGDGRIYVIFSSAADDHAHIINSRLARSGLCLEPVTEPLDVFLEGVGGRVAAGPVEQAGEREKTHE